MIETELVDIVGRDYVLTSEADRMIYGVDYFWLPRMLIDRGRTPPLPSTSRKPSSATAHQEVRR